MKKTFFGLIFLPLLLASTAESEVVVRNEVSGDNASVYTEITNIVNGQETKVESDQPGEIKVEAKNGEVKVTSSPEVRPTVIINQEVQGEQENQVEEENQEEKKMVNRVEEMRTRILDFWGSFLSRLRRIFVFHT